MLSNAPRRPRSLLPLPLLALAVLLTGAPALGAAGEGCALTTEVARAADGRESWRKTVTCRDAAEPLAALRGRLAAGAALLAKRGGAAEIRPLANPALLRPGSDLPLRIDLANAPRAGARVEVVGPRGVRQLRADAGGFAVVRIDAPGRFTVRGPVDPGVAATAELRLEVRGADFWRALPDPEVLFAGPSRPRAKLTDERWRPLGPTPVAGGAADTGRVAAIAVSRQRVNRYYAGAASGGVWESTDGGASWQTFSAGLPTLAIGALAVDPADDRRIYAGTGEANYAFHSLYGLGLYVSPNRGRTWQPLAPELFAGRTFSRIVVSPHASDELWVAVARAGGTFRGVEGGRQHPQVDGPMGLFHSPDRGRTWRRLNARDGLPTFAASDVDLDPRDPRRIYASFGDPFERFRNGVYRSTDGGATFTPILTRERGLESPIGRLALAIAPSAPDRLYALTVRPASRESFGGFFPPGAATEGLYRSDDGGDTWRRFAVDNFQGQQGDYNIAVAVDPADPDTVFLGGIQLLRSTDGGATFADATPPHVDQHDLVFDAAGRLLAANDGGVHRSGDGARSWAARNVGLSTLQLYPGVALHPGDPDVLLGGTQDNGTWIRLGGPVAWTPIFGGDGGVTAFHPDDPGVIFVQYQGTNNLLRADGDLAFVEIGGGIDPDDRNCFLPPYVLDPANPDRMLYGTHRIWESRDRGTTWRAISGDLTAGPPAAVRSLAIAPSNANVVYATTNDGRVLVSSTGGADFELGLEGLGGWPRVMRQIAVDPRRPNHAVVADMRFGGARVLLSVDRGRSWRSIAGDLPDLPVNTVAIHRQGARRTIFAGTDAGAFRTVDDGRTWRRFGPNLPRAPVMDLVVDARHGRLVAATLGRGVWEIGLGDERP